MASNFSISIKDKNTLSYSFTSGSETRPTYQGIYTRDYT
jgi:hypothetical protein